MRKWSMVSNGYCGWAVEVFLLLMYTLEIMYEYHTTFMMRTCFQTPGPSEEIVNQRKYIDKCLNSNYYPFTLLEK